MPATRALYDSGEFPDGAIVDMPIWLVPDCRWQQTCVQAQPVLWFYGYPGRRIVGYDNERGKGDHRHLDGREEPYWFSSVETLISDFLSDIRRMRGEK